LAFVKLKRAEIVFRVSPRNLTRRHMIKYIGFTDTEHAKHVLEYALSLLFMIAFLRG
jgi:hypothetical protein